MAVLACGPGKFGVMRNQAATSTDAVVGYTGPGADHPRKYVKGGLRNAYVRVVPRSGEMDYRHTCEHLMKIDMNSSILARLRSGPSSKYKLLGGTSISLRDNYVGERGFIALLPILDQNNTWTTLDASNNGLRNEAVLHLVDLLLQPHHGNRAISLDLSRNPISTTSAYALMELVRLHPKGVIDINLHLTKVPRRLAFMLRGMAKARAEDAENKALEAAAAQTEASRFLRVSEELGVHAAEAKAAAEEAAAAELARLRKSFDEEALAAAAAEAAAEGAAEAAVAAAADTALGSAKEMAEEAEAAVEGGSTEAPKAPEAED